MFLLGQWKNFDDLEDSVTLDELVQIYNTLTERENRKMEFQAKMAGAELPSSPVTTSAKEDTDSDTLEARLRKRRQEKSATGNTGSKPGEFSHGVGHTVIGG